MKANASKPAPAAPILPTTVTDPRDEMLTKLELAAKLKVTDRTIENWQRDGYLPFYKISTVVLFYWPDVLEHLKKNFRVCRGGTIRPQPGI